MNVGSLLRSEVITASVFSQIHQEQIVAGETTKNIVTSVQYDTSTMTGTRVDWNRNGTPDVLKQPQFEHMDTMTVTDTDMNRNDIPDFLQQPQFDVTSQDFATPVLYGAPVNKEMTTVTGVDMNCDGIPYFL